jgi:hypothetical protein
MLGHIDNPEALVKYGHYLDDPFEWECFLTDIEQTNELVTKGISESLFLLEARVIDEKLASGLANNFIKKRKFLDPIFTLRRITKGLISNTNCCLLAEALTNANTKTDHR